MILPIHIEGNLRYSSSFCSHVQKDFYLDVGYSPTILSMHVLYIILFCPKRSPYSLDVGIIFSYTLSILIQKEYSLDVSYTLSMYVQKNVGYSPTL